MVLRRLFGRARSEAAFEAPCPEHPVWVIGDVHGAKGLLDDLLERIDAQSTVEDPPNIVLAGDYVDRGEDSAGVLETVKALEETNPRVTALLGNHEVMMLRFLTDPLGGARWLHYGGVQTLASFGVEEVTETSPTDDIALAAERFLAALPSGMEIWLRSLPTHWSSGNVTVVHAGADPSRPIAEQSEKTLTFGHPDFFRKPRKDGAWVAHGHTITDKPGSDGQGRIAVDTGAYYTGRLTAALILPSGDVSLLST